MSLWEDYRDDARADADIREAKREKREAKQEKRERRTTNKPRENSMTITTRRPTGVPAWPMILIAGAEKTGKTYTSAQASTSTHIGRTFWFAYGEDEPDEYGALPGQRIEIVDHDGTPGGLLNAIRAASTEPKVDGKPNMIVLDSGTRLWQALSELAQHDADDRAKKKAERYGRAANPAGENDIGMDLWNKAKTRHARIIAALRDHDGPVIITARMDQVTLLDKAGKPTAEKDWKIQTEKSLPYDVGAIVQIPERGTFQLKGVRSLRLNIGDQAQTVPDFTVETLWERMGLFDGETQGRRQRSVAAEDVAQERARVLAALSALYPSDEQWQQLDQWWQGRHGVGLEASDDLDALRELVARTTAKRAEAVAGDEQKEAA